MSDLEAQLLFEKASVRRLAHANHVLTKALSDFCSGRVTETQLKAWWLKSQNPKLLVDTAETKA